MTKKPPKKIKLSATAEKLLAKFDEDAVNYGIYSVANGNYSVNTEMQEEMKVRYKLSRDCLSEYIKELEIRK